MSSCCKAVQMTCYCSSKLLSLGLGLGLESHPHIERRIQAKASRPVLDHWSLNGEIVCWEPKVPKQLSYTVNCLAGAKETEVHLPDGSSFLCHFILRDCRGIIHPPKIAILFIQISCSSLCCSTPPVIVITRGCALFQFTSMNLIWIDYRKLNE